MQTVAIPRGGPRGHIVRRTGDTAPFQFVSHRHTPHAAAVVTPVVTLGVRTCLDAARKRIRGGSGRYQPVYVVGDAGMEHSAGAQALLAYSTKGLHGCWSVAVDRAAYVWIQSDLPQDRQVRTRQQRSVRIQH